MNFLKTRMESSMWSAALVCFSKAICLHAYSKSKTDFAKLADSLLLPFLSSTMKNLTLEMRFRSSSMRASGN